MYSSKLRFININSNKKGLTYFCQTLFKSYINQGNYFPNCAFKALYSVVISNAL